MSIAEAIERREITQVLHFTTNLGLLGMLAKGAILSREQLPEDKYLEHVYRPNAEVRRDGPWLDYVNLSITGINTEFFDHSRRWHDDEDVWWCVVALEPEILTHPGVLFATTNNMYTGCRRGAGEESLEALFGERVELWRGNALKRAEGLKDNQTTCHQAEVLYPRSVLLHYFTQIYVATEKHSDIVGSQSEILLPVHAGPTGPQGLPIYVRPDVFEPRR
jgi:ssDNA thymidine ADP-ribosyltransferase, DarT